LSYAQLAENGRTLAHPKIRKVTRWDQAKVDAFLRQLLLRSELVDTLKSLRIPQTHRSSLH